MTFEEYQAKAHETNQYPKEYLMECLALGLCSEAGEVAGKVKKSHRDGIGFNHNGVIDEIGDCIWYCSELARLCGVTLQEVAERNISKLASRAIRNQIKGNGDDR